MAWRLASQPASQKTQPIGKGSKRREDPDYLDFIRSLPCLVTHREGVQAAHVSYAEPKAGKVGRGKGVKESDCWAVPLCPEEHARQHSMDERAYWASVGIDPITTAAFLHAAYPSRDRALLVIRNIVRGSDIAAPTLWRHGELSKPVAFNEERE